MTTPIQSASLRQRLRLGFPMLLALGVSAGAQAAVLSFNSATHSAFTRDDDIFVASFSLATSGAVSLRSFSWGGGSNGQGELIAAGGFAPVLNLFGSAGSVHLGQAQPNGNFLCSGPASNASAGEVNDVCLDFASLSAGSYIVTLTQYDNLFSGTDFNLDPFDREGQGDFTGGPFIHPGLLGPVQRNGEWAFDVSIPDMSVPLPGTTALTGLGLALLLFSRRPDALKRA